MKTLIIALLIPFVLVLELCMTVCSLGFYIAIMTDEDGLLTQQLIDKL